MPQKVKGFNKKVQEVAPTDQESEAWITAIINGLALAEQHNEYHEGFMHWINELNNYLQMFELHFSKETHLQLIQLMYQHMTNLEHDSLIQLGCMDALYRLLKHTKCLQPSDLRLDWRPLYNLARHYKNFQSSIIRHGNDFIRISWRQFQRCAARASPYFEPDATRQILDELSPRLCKTSVDFETQSHYLALLPVCFLPGVSQADTIDLWAKPILKFWPESAIGTKVEALLAQTLANLVDEWHDCIDWEPHLANLCSLVHRSMRLPVGKAPNSMQPPRILSSQGHGHDRSKGAEDRLMGKLAALLIGAIRPGSDAAVNHIGKLLRLVEPYMHPSNSGRWMLSVASLIRKLLTKLVHRLTDERHGHSHKVWWRLPPKEAHISDSQRLALFNMLLEPAFMLIHARGYTISMASCANLICQLNPGPFLQRLFVELQPALMDSSQPHRLCALLLMASRVGLAIVRYSPEEVVPLLHSVLPLLELSNPLRLAAALSLIKELIHEISLDTSLEEFSALFMDRVLAIAESLLTGTGFGASSKSAAGLSPLLEIFYNMLMQGSDEIQSILINKFKTWSAGAAYEPEGAAKTVLRLFAAFSGSLPSSIVPWCIEQAVATLEAEGGPEVAQEERVSSKLLWDIAALENAVSNTDTFIDNCLIAGRDQLAYVLRCCLRAKDKRLSKLAQRLFVELSTGGLLVELYPTLDCQAYRKIGWGERCRLKEMTVSWHRPRQEELQLVQWMADKFLWPEVQLLTEHLDETNVLEKQDLLRCVSCLSAFAQSAWQVLSPPPNEADDPTDSNAAPPSDYPLSVSLRQGPKLPSHLLRRGGDSAAQLRIQLGNEGEEKRDARQILLDLFVRLAKAIAATDLSEILQQAIAGITALMLPGPRVSVTSTLDVLRLRDNAESDWLLELGRGQDSATRHLRRLTGFCQLRSQLAWPRANSRLPDIVDQLIGLVGSPYRTVSTDASVALVLGALTLMIGGTAPGYAAINHLFYVPDWQARRILCRCLATVQLSDHSNKAEVCTVLAPVSDPHCPNMGHDKP
uniref:BLM10_mid domain-containing protein n=1 Tax=Macrostomum lignano TaxID=282301 RepID=A0A1I8IMA5_9PLAT